jgi:hypothetical protein
LRKQDAVLQLQQRLEDLDKNEARPLFLASFRRDRNMEREEVLNKLDAALADYGKWRLLWSKTRELTRPQMHYWSGMQESPSFLLPCEDTRRVCRIG